MPKIEDMWLTPCPRPNGLQAADDGLWVISADDGSRLQKLDYETGEAMIDVTTETFRSSGLTVGGGNVWVASTHNSRLYKLNDDGSTVSFHEPPGSDVWDPRDTGPNYNRPHGMEWMGDTIWIAAKPALRLYLVDSETLEPRHSIPTPGAAPHGIAWDGETLWCADRAMQKIHRLDPDNGDIHDEIEVKSPELHGLTMHDGALWFCCDPSGRVCRIEL
ncbi:MAG: hypothetical protein J4G14_06130 [Dehalococcoidia bacterium]|nr:hypothetical protein [Dehalococcoidia bacterium]